MLSAAELTEMRAEVALAMPSSAAITRRAATTNAMGGRDATPAAVSGMSAVACHVHPDTQRGVSEAEAGGRIGAAERFRIMFAYGTDVRVTDIATVDGKAYELVQVDTPRSWALEVEAIGVRRG